MNLAAITLRAAVLKVLADEIAASLTGAKETAKAAFRATGTTQAIPSLPSGFKVATASLAGGGPAASVVNDAAFLAWVQQAHPGEIVTSVRESFKDKVLAASKQAGKPIDPATGEVVPGVRVGQSTPYVSLRFKPGGKDAIIAAWRAGELSEVELVAPAAIESSDAA